MKNFDEGLMQIQYEVFGEDTKSLAKQYDTSPTMIDYIAEEKGWRRLPIAKSAQEWTDQPVGVVDDDLLAQVRHRMRILQTIKQNTLNPRYIAIESVMLSKLQTVIASIDETEPGAASRLKTAADTFASLRSGQQTPEEQAANSAGPKLVVNIMNQVPDGYKVSQHAQVQVLGASSDIDGGCRALS